MPFIDASESFTNGFECGQIYQMMERKEVFENYLIHSCNKEQIKLIAIRFGYAITVSESIDIEWCYLNGKIDLTKNN